MNDPDLILAIHRHADHGADDPVVRQRLRPHRIDFESRRLDAGGLHGRPFLQRRSCERDQNSQHTRRQIKVFRFMLFPSVQARL